MTIRQFQELYYILQNKDQDIDKSIKMVGVMTGQTPEQIEVMPMNKFNKICNKVKNKFEIFNINLLKTVPKKLVYVKGRIYRINYRVDKPPINAGKYVEAITFGKDIVQNLHKIMASIVTPVNFIGREYHREHEDIANDLESMDFEVAYHAAVFFCIHYKVSMQLILPSLIQEVINKGGSKEEAEATLNNSLNILDGFIMPKWSLNMREYLSNRFGILG